MQDPVEYMLSRGSLGPRIDRPILAAVEAGRNPRQSETTDAEVFLRELLRQVSPSFSPTRSQFETAVKTSIKRIVPHFRQCTVFGSSVTLLNLATSDIDMVVVENSGIAEKELVLIIAPMLSTQLRQLPSFDVIPIDGATVPLVRVSSGDLQCDISFNSQKGLRTTRLISRYVERYPVMIPLTRLLKVWRLRRKLPDAAVKGLGSYGWSVMIMAFLQMYFADHIAEDWTLLSLLRDFVRTFSNLVPDRTVHVSLRRSNPIEVVEGTGSMGADYRWAEIRKPDHLNHKFLMGAASASVIAAELDRARTLVDRACLTQSRANLQLLFEPITDEELELRSTTLPATGPA